MNKFAEETKFKSLLSHAGHHIECVVYGNEETGVVNIAVECETCNEVLFSMDKPRIMKEYIPIPNKYPEEIALRWSIDDVFAAISNNGIKLEPPLTNQEAAFILHEAKENYDEETPITWNTFIQYIKKNYSHRIKN